MSGIITAVFKATIGWLVDKGRDKAAEKLKDGDVTDHQFRGIIMREIHDMKSRLDGLSKKDLLASISFFKEGIELLYKVFDETRLRSEYGEDTAQTACFKTVEVTEGMQTFELTEHATRKLANEKKRFERAREMATIAFSNEALSTSDRILAMQYRVMSTELETINNPGDAVASCKDGEEEPKINEPLDNATNSSGKYIVGDHDLTIKVFDDSGKFVERFRLPPLIDGSGNELLVSDWPVGLATDISDNIYVLVREKNLVDPYWIFKFKKTADQYHMFHLRKMSLRCEPPELSVIVQK
ncbi:hypothetical protein AWC38_SpisGene13906 [Stylophora pistillata]|uniref:Uncharacterized protein n=1 Tax=Stylophora pistillata TaxID=50429 RepID=A0A2B4RZ51_STYPI|nr:hypothetical protein AWC38_SpisGene13906 [Stylophora pistillata]